MEIKKVEQEFSELIKLVESEQDLKIEIYDGSTNEIIEMRELGDTVQNENSFNVRFRIREKEVRLTHIYLKKKNKGTGSKVIEWLLRFIRKNKLDSLLIVNVDLANMGAVKCYEKFDGLWENETEDLDDKNRVFADYRINSKN